MEHLENDILRSLEGARRAEPDPNLYGKIRARIITGAPMRVVSRPHLALAAACLAGLVLVNIWAFSQQNVNSTIPSAYQVETANFNLY